MLLCFTKVINMSIYKTKWFKKQVDTFFWGTNYKKYNFIFLSADRDNDLPASSDWHLPVWQWTQSGGGAACAACSPCRWSRRRPADKEPPRSPSPMCLSSCCDRCLTPRATAAAAATTPGWASSCPQIWSATPPLVVVGQRVAQPH